MTRRGETLELAVLGLLHENPMHGYELRKQLNLVLGWGRVLSYGSLYPALKKMLRAALIDENVTTPTPVTAPRRASSTSSPQAGDERFERLMSEAGPAAWEDDNFDVRFAFFGRTDREIRLRILEGRRARLEERLARVQSQLAMTQKEVDQLRRGAPAPRRGVGGARGALALGPDRRGAHQRPTDHQQPPRSRGRHRPGPSAVSTTAGHRQLTDNEM